MRTIKLYGALGKTFGRIHKLDVSNAAEAVRALCVVVDGFRDYMFRHADNGFRVLIGDNQLDEKQLHDAHSGDIKIIPVVAGSGGVGRIVLGAALIGLPFYAPGVGSTFLSQVFNTTASGFLGTTTIGSIASSIGWSLVLGGVSQMLFSPPSQSSTGTERANNLPSYAFDGAVNTVSQGNAVPLAYGELIVGSQVISTGLSVEDVPV